MTELHFTVLDIEPEAYAASPQLTARIRVAETSGAVVHAMALKVQVRIEPQRRAYSEEEQRGLLDLFGTRERWSSTLRPFLWMQTSTTVPGFTGSAQVELPLPCTYDFEVAAAKYLHALRDGVIRLSLLFSGTVFTRGTTGFGVEQIAWNCDATYELPVAVWRRAMDQFFPDSGWVRLNSEALDALGRYRSEHGLTSWEATVHRLVTGAEEPVR